MLRCARVGRRAAAGRFGNERMVNDMPATYDSDDMVLELKQELATAEDNLKAEFAAHGKTLERLHRTEERLSRIEAKIKAFADDHEGDKQ